jgi:hypothetical protein
VDLNIDLGSVHECFGRNSEVTAQRNGLGSGGESWCGLNHDGFHLIEKGHCLL